MLLTNNSGTFFIHLRIEKRYFLVYKLIIFKSDACLSGAAYDHGIMAGEKTSGPDGFRAVLHRIPPSKDRTPGRQCSCYLRVVTI